MNNFLKFVLSIAIALVAVASYNYFLSADQRTHDLKLPTEPNVGLSKLDKLLRSKRIIKVTDHVHVAIGFALGNMIMLEGDDGIIIVDTTESEPAARKIFKEFRKLTQKPLKGIIITHFHKDHVVGAQALLDDAKDPDVNIRVFTHSSTAYELTRFLTSTDAVHIRTGKQFAIPLKHGSDIDGRPILHTNRTHGYRLVNVTDTFDVEQQYTLAGINFNLIHTPGETNDQTTVWIPDWRIVFPADNVYKAFPNLYAIRGTPPRSFVQWYRSLDQVRRLRAEYMVPSHTEPVKGEEKVFDVITHYRDAIQYINDQTIRLMNAGLDIDEIVERVQLPPSLASHPYLQQYYGTVPWSVRGAYNAQLGWFDGDPVNLFPLSKRKRAKRLEELLATDFGPNLSGTEKMLKKSGECYKKFVTDFQRTGRGLSEDLQWSLELSFNALKSTSPGSSLHEQAKTLAVASLKSLASFTMNLNARNYYLTSAKELEYDLEIRLTANSKSDAMSGLKISEIMEQFPIRFVAESCDDDTILVVIFAFSDVKESYSFIMRHCILEYNNEPSRIPKEFDAKVTMSSTVLKDILGKRKNPMGAYASGDLEVEGSMFSIKRFMDLIVKN